jgi:hypothetical protein
VDWDKMNLPRIFTLEQHTLADVKIKIAAGDRSFDAPLAQLEKEADKALAEGPWSVVNKPMTPPSGDKHDYISLARYFWPDPSKPNGLPYIQLDGQVNPEIWSIPDHKDFDALMDNVLTLALAFYFTGDERYSSYATRLMRVWFLDEPTRMNPSLNYCQGIRGLNDGRNVGLIETRELVLVVDAIGLLAGSNAWTDADQWGMERWFTRFLDWLVWGEMGKLEGEQRNNHGTFYDAQVIGLALFLGADELAKRFLEKAPRRIAEQIEPDGRQPLELERPIAWHYIVFNLQALFRVATFGEHLGIDLWHYAAQDGRTLRRAIDFTLPYVAGKPWDYQQITPQKFDVIFGLLCQASCKYRDESYLAKALVSPGVDHAGHRARLLFNIP